MLSKSKTFKEIQKVFWLSILAGILIGIGGSVFLMCKNTATNLPELGTFIGAVFFCVALLSICYFGFYLYTGKIGYIVYSHTKADVFSVLVGLIGNFLGAVGSGLLLSYVKPEYNAVSSAICNSKLNYMLNNGFQGYFGVFILGVFCGILMFVAVNVFKENKSIVGILFGIPVFILCGFEHSIADMFYFGAANNIFNLNSLLFLLLVVLGNTIGGMLIPVLKNLSVLTVKNKESENNSETKN